MAATDVRDDELPAGAGSAAEVRPIPAASVLLLREAESGASAFEVLMIFRQARSSFAPSAWVFPGGVLDAEDRALGAADELASLRVCAARELFEETGIWLGTPPRDLERQRGELLAGRVPFALLLAEGKSDTESLILTARWITPVGVPKRFDTWFFVCRAPEKAEATVEEREAVDATWIDPSDALRRHASGDFPMIFPTIRNLEAIASFGSIEALLSDRRVAEIKVNRPVLEERDGRKTIVLPDEPE